jgi:hypothetical protein
MSYIGNVKVDSTTHLVGSTLYGTCSTGAGTQAKVVTCANFDKLLTGVTIHVKFDNSNTIADPTLNVNSTGAKAIKRYGTTAPSTTASTSWNAGQVVSFTYDGTYWMMNDFNLDTDVNTHRAINVDGTAILANNTTTALNLKSGSNVSISATSGSGDVTINAVDTNIHRCTMDSSSTATAFVVNSASGDNITALTDGLTIYVRNTVIASASGCTLKLNSLDAKRIWLSQGNGYCTTHWAKNQAYIFVYNATDQVWELQQGRDTDTTTTNATQINLNSNALKAGSSALVAGNIIVAGSDGLYKHLKAGTAFDITYPIVYLAKAVAASATTNDVYTEINFTVTTTQSITLTAQKPVYIKGTLDGKLFTPISTAPLTQTVPTTADGYHYMYLGYGYTTTAIRLQTNHPIYAYKNGKFGQIVNDALSVNGYTVATSVPSGALFTDTQSNWNETTTTSKAYIQNKPTLGTASAKDVPSSGNASTTQVVMGNDTRLSDSRTPSSHTHGNIQNGGTLQTNDVDIDSGDKLIITDSSNSNKITRSSTSFDGSTTTTALTPKGTFETFLKTAPVTSVAGKTGAVTLDNSDVGLGNVGNFKAVSTVASQGLTSTEKSNARTNIGAGTGNGTITGITMNGASKGTSGVVDLGTVLTSYTETDPTVPSWAKADTKPTYTASEVGALASNGTAVNSERLSNTSKVGNTNRPVYFTANGVPAQISYTIDKSVPSTAVFTDASVTAVGNHYAPTEDSTATLSADASGGSSATWNSTQLVTGVDIKRDAKGHVTGVAVDSIKLPSNPNTNNRRAFYGTCSTAAATAAKVVTLSNTDGWELVEGTIVGIHFSKSNTAENVTLNINGTGDKSIYYNNAVYAGTSNAVCGYANRTSYYMYDGTYWVFLSNGIVDSNTDTKVRQTLQTGDANRPLLMAYSNNTTTTTNVDNVTYRNNNIYANPSTGTITATNLSIAPPADNATFPSGAITVHDVRNVTSVPTTRGLNFIMTNEGNPINNSWYSGIYCKSSGGTYAAWELVGCANDADTRTSPFYVRGSNKTTAWGDWRKLYDSSNPPTASEVGAATSTHTHGNIANGGTISSDTAIANGHKIVTVDGNNKVSRSPITFDNSTTTQCLTKKGTWASFTNNAGTVTGVKVNGTTKSPSSGIVDIGTVATSDTTYSFTGGTNCIYYQASSASTPTQVTFTPSITGAITGNGEAGYMPVFTGANTVDKGVKIIPFAKQTTITGKTTLSYTGVSFTVPSGYMAILAIRARFVNAQPDQTLISTSSTSIVDYQVADISEGGQCSFNFYNTEASTQTFYVWAKYYTQGNARIDIEGIYLANLGTPVSSL